MTLEFAWVIRRLPWFCWNGRVERLGGGNLNFVWRLHGTPCNLIVKQAPPFVAASPHQPLDPGRIGFEASVLKAFQEGGALQRLVSDHLRPPRLWHHDAEQHAIVLEDVGFLPHLGEQMVASARVCSQLGSFLARLHRTTWNDSALAQKFQNLAIQESRLEIQYAKVGVWLSEAGHPWAEQVGQAAIQLGRRFLRTGSCLVMGDLWPPSILLDRQRIRLIDWEFCHFGRPAQDFAHLCAHLFLMGPAGRPALRSFYRAYLRKNQNLLDSAECATHYGCEILMRTLGPFRSPNVDRTAVVEHAVESILTGRLPDGIREEGMSSQKS